MKVLIWGEEFEVDKKLHPTFWKSAEERKWEFETFIIIDEFLKKGDIAVDLGCWQGPISLYMARKGAIVHAIDPDPKAYSALIKNIQLNNSIKDKIKTHNIAIAQNTGALKLYVREGFGNSSTSLLERAYDRKIEFDAKGMSLKDFFKWQQIEKINLLKIDIEGEEFFIAKYLVEAKRNKMIDSIILSIHYQHINEFIYQKKIANKFFSRLLMWIEKKLKIYLFKKEMLAYLNEISLLCEEFDSSYYLDGKGSKANGVTPKDLLNHKVDLFLSDKIWDLSKRH